MAKKYGKRIDGTDKDVGYLGEISTEDNSGVMTEYSINPQGKGEMPSIVEGMHPADINALRHYEQVTRKGGKAEFPNDVEAVAKRSAKKRKAEGKSPFYSSKEKKMNKGGTVRGHGCEKKGKTRGRIV